MSCTLRFDVDRLGHFSGNRRRRGAGRVQHPSRGRRASRERLVMESLEAKIMLAADVFTDKSDYAPGETAYIAAVDFQAGETIEFHVVHSDGTPNTGGGHEPWQVTDGSEADLDGTVDGIIVTTWFVNPDDSSNSSFVLTATGLSSGAVATTTFTDSDALTITVDQNGPDDVPSQSDLNSMGFDTSHLDEDDPFYSIQFSFDDTDYPGGNTGDACALIDSDGDSNVDFAFCSQIGDPDADGTVDYLASFLYDCKDTKNNRCFTSGGGGDGSAGLIAQSDPTDTDGDGIPDNPFTLAVDENGVPLATPLDSGATMQILATDPFSADGGHLGEQDPINDAVILVTLFTDELTEKDGDVLGNANLTNVCTFPSPQANSDDKDCVVNPGSAFLKIVKDVGTDPTDTTFDFKLDGGASFVSITGNGETDSIPLAADTYLLEEIFPPLWQIDSVISDNGTPEDPSDDYDLLLAVGGTAAGGLVHLDPGERETITFTNSLAVVPPELVVIKGAALGQDVIASIPEPGGAVTFDVEIINTAAADKGDATLTHLMDDQHGNLFDPGNTAVSDNTCLSLFEATLLGNDSLTCSFKAVVSGNAGEFEIDTVTATASNLAGEDTASDDARVNIFDVIPAPPTLVKTANPTSVPEPGADVEFTVVITNNDFVEALTLNSLDDDIYGDIADASNPNIVSTTCLVSQTLMPSGQMGDTYSCSFVAPVAGNAGSSQTDVVTGNLTDDEGNVLLPHDDAVVTITDVAPTIDLIKGNAEGNDNVGSVSEPGGSIVFAVSVENTSVSTDPVTLTSLTDDVYGDITQVQGDVTATTCSLGTIQPGDTYTCSFTANVNGQGGTNQVDELTATGTDDEGTGASDSDQANVDINDVAPTIDLIKGNAEGNDNVGSVSEPGGSIVFAVSVENTSVSTDPVTLTSLIDDVYGDVTQVQGGVTATTCSLETIQPGDTYTCSFTANVNGQGGTNQVDELTATGTDDEGTGASDSDQANVDINDVAPTIDLIKGNAEGNDNVGSVNEPGGSIVFAVSVENTSVSTDPVTLTSLIDDVYGDVTQVQGDVTATTCSLETIQPGDTYTCSFTANVNGQGGTNQVDELTATGTDDEGTGASDSDQANVDINDVAPTIDLIKGNAEGNDNVGSVSEPGGSIVFAVSVENTSVSTDPVTLTSLTDDVYGDVTQVQGDVTATTCSLETIQPGDTYTCSFTANVNGQGGTNQVDELTATGTDDEGTGASDSDQANVDINDVAPTIDLIKGNAEGNDNVGSVNEPGGSIVFAVSVENTSVSTDPVTLTSLIDDVYGDVTQVQGDVTATTCSLETIQPGDTYTCSFTANVNGQGGTNQVDELTATGTDDEGTGASDSDQANVDINDVAPTIDLIKGNAEGNDNVGSVNEPGGSIVFAVSVENTSVSTDPVTLTSLTDDVYGDITQVQGDVTATTCSLGTIQPGDTYTCSFTANVNGQGDTNQVDTLTATASDDEGNTPAEDSDQANVNITDVAPTIDLIKGNIEGNDTVGSVAEPGGSIVFAVSVENTSVSGDPVTLTSLDDDVYGDVTQVQGDVTATTCSLETIQPGDTYTCSFTANVNGQGGTNQVDELTATGTDDEGTGASDSDQANVDINDVAPTIDLIKGNAEGNDNVGSVNEPGGSIVFAVSVENTSVSTDPVTLTSLIDDVYGDVTQVQGDVTATTCSLETIQPGDTYTCSFTANVNGQGGTNQVDELTATGTDDEGTGASDSDQANVDINDVAPTIDLIKGNAEGNDNVGSVNEPGGSIVFAVSVENTSVSTDPVTLTSLTDDVYGDITQVQGDVTATTCSLGTIQPGDTYTCSFTANVNGQGDTNQVDTLTATASDDEGNTPAEDSDQANVNITDVAPTIDLIKGNIEGNDTVGSVAEPGGSIVFAVSVENTSVSGDPVTLTSLDDDVYGDVTQVQGDVTATTCSLETIQPGDTYTCSFTASVNGQGNTNQVVDTLTATASDDEGNTPAQDSDQANVVLLPILQITKTAIQEVVNAGETAEFEIVVSNVGQGIALDVVVTDNLPSPNPPFGLTWAESHADCDILANVLTCNVDEILPGTQFSVVVSAAIPVDYFDAAIGNPVSSDFEIDGNLIDELPAPEVDWFDGGSLLQGAVDKEDLPSGSTDNRFEKGADENTEDPSIGFGQVPPNKNDLLHFLITQRVVEGNVFLITAFNREETNGSMNMDVEFNQATQLYPNSGMPLVPVRTEGDLLITFDVGSAGNNIQIGLREWVVNAGVGTWGASNPVAGFANAEINLVTIDNPWEPASPLAPTTVAEAEINLTKAIPGACRSFGSAYVKSRASDSFTAALKDFVERVDLEFDTCTTFDLPNTASAIASNHIQVDSEEASIKLTNDPSAASPSNVANAVAQLVGVDANRDGITSSLIAGDEVQDEFVNDRTNNRLFERVLARRSRSYVNARFTRLEKVDRFFATVNDDVADDRFRGPLSEDVLAKLVHDRLARR